MTSTPNANGRFIGRVGALAVALGLGVAIANSPGLAAADDGSSASSDTSSSTSGAATNTSGRGTTNTSGGATNTSGQAGASDPDDKGSATTSRSTNTTTNRTVDDHTDSTDAKRDDKEKEDDDRLGRKSDDHTVQNGKADDDPLKTGDQLEDDTVPIDVVENQTASGAEDASPSSTPQPSDQPDDESRNSGRDGQTNVDAEPVSRRLSMRESTADVTFTGTRHDTYTFEAETLRDEPTGVAARAETPTLTEAPMLTETLMLTETPMLTETLTLTETPMLAERVTLAATPAPTTPTVTTGVHMLVGTVLSALGLGPQAANGPTPTPQAPVLWAMLGWARREIGRLAAPLTSAAGAPVAALVAEDALDAEDALGAEAVSPLATPEQLAAERIATETVNTLPVTVMKLVLRQQFLSAAQQLYPEGIDAENMAALDRAVDEYAMAAAFQQQLLDSMNPKVVTQVASPHIWFGQTVGGSRILYDNPDTIYRFMAVNGASEYVITGRFNNLTAKGRPADTTFSVLEGLAGTTSSILTADDLEINEDGTFTITASTQPANGRKNHLQLTPGSTIIAARDTLGDWNSEEPMSLSIERVAGPPDSLFAQIGGFAFLGRFVSANPLLTSLVSVVPPLPDMPPLLRGVFTALILVVRGGSEQAKYMALATTDPETGQPRPTNVIGQPASNAEFLANQLQSNGHFQLADDEALVLTIDPGNAGYFVVPTYNVWTITDDYWNEPASLNNEQAVRNEDGTYTVVISPTDPGAANWVSTSGLNQGTVAIRFQDLGPDTKNPPRIVDQRVVSHAALRNYLPPDDFVTAEQRAAQLALRKAGFDKRWAPYPQP